MRPHRILLACAIALAPGLALADPPDGHPGPDHAQHAPDAHHEPAHHQAVRRQGANVEHKTVEVNRNVNVHRNVTVNRHVVNHVASRPGPRWARGGRYGGPRRVFADYGRYHLRPPPPGYQWVQDDNELVLIALATGVITETYLISLN